MIIDQLILITKLLVLPVNQLKFSKQMNLKMIRSKNEIENFLLSISKNCETLIYQSRTHPQETLEIKKSKTRETFHLNPPIQIEGDWMIGLTSLENYNSLFNTTEENNKVEFYKFPVEKAGGVL